MTQFKKGLCFSAVSVLIGVAVNVSVPATAQAYPIVAEQCKKDPVACAMSGKLPYISVYGRIDSTDAEFFKNIDQALPKEKPLPPVYVDSGGGSMAAAESIGRILRRRKATVISGSPYFPDKFVACESACVLLAAGATVRRVTEIGLHQGFRRIPTGLHTWKDVPLPKNIVDREFKYLSDMGIPPAIQEVILKTSSSDMAYFSYDPSRPASAQKIVKFGFFMPSASESSPETPVLPTRAEGIAAFKLRYENAIKYGSNAALEHYVGLILHDEPGDPSKYAIAAKWLAVGAARDDLRSLHHLAFIMDAGLSGKADHEAAGQLYLRAAKLGFGPSQNNIGWHFYKGEGVKRSIGDAIFWVTRSADQGQAFAYGSLCEMYDGGDAFRPDPIEEMKWCLLAVKNEPKGAARSGDEAILKKISASMSGADRKAAETEANAWVPLRKSVGMFDPSQG